MIKDNVFTSESVSDGHPDKVCDQISDAILDACLEQDPKSRVAIETGIKNSRLFLIGELTTSAEIDPTHIAKQVLIGIGYDDPRWGIDLSNINIVEEIGLQSPEISAGVDRSESGAGDQGLMFGFACNQTSVQLPLPIALAHRLMIQHHKIRQDPNTACWVGPDAKAQVTVQFDRNGSPESITDVVVSSQHSSEDNLEKLRDTLLNQVIKVSLGNHWHQDIRLHINPAGPFTKGGPAADAGLTGRKIIVDTYGGFARHGGGAFSGKDATKVDRSAAYAARQLAAEVVRQGWAPTCEVQVSYAIGISRPINISFDTNGAVTGPEIERQFMELGIDPYEALRPQNIIERLQLQQPVFQATSTFGHFGRSEFSWERPMIN
jgi:S-adenosylmethionine synthetase